MRLMRISVIVRGFGLLAVAGTVALVPVFNPSRDATPNAHAGPPPPSTWILPIPSLPLTAKGPKPAPTPAGSADDIPPPDCLTAAYAALAAKVPGLRAKYGTDEVAYASAFGAEKKALVSDEALLAVGCVRK